MIRVAAMIHPSNENYELNHCRAGVMRKFCFQRANCCFQYLLQNVILLVSQTCTKHVLYCSFALAEHPDLSNKVALFQTSEPQLLAPGFHQKPLHILYRVHEHTVQHQLICLVLFYWPKQVTGLGDHLS